MADAQNYPEVDSDEEDDDSGGEDLPPPPAAYLRKGPRTSVSAEAYGEWNQRTAFAPTVYQKADDQKLRIMQVLNSSFLFNTLEAQDLSMIVDAMVERPVNPGERLIQEGDDGDCMFLIEQGTFDCKKRIEGQELVVKRCEAGDFFGELALLYNCPRAASVEALTPGVTWQLDRETFNHVVRDASIKKRELYEEFVKSVQILHNLGQYERWQLVDALRPFNAQAGTTLINQGELGDKFFLIEEGQCVVYKDGVGVLMYQRGNYFGELALIRNEVRAASVVATTDARLLWIDRKTFTQLLGAVTDSMISHAATYTGYAQ